MRKNLSESMKDIDKLSGLFSYSLKQDFKNRVRGEQSLSIQGQGIYKQKHPKYKRHDTQEPGRISKALELQQLDNMIAEMGMGESIHQRMKNINFLRQTPF